MSSSSPFNAIKGIVDEIGLCETAGATAATVVMAYVGIDAMAYLNMPIGQTSQTRKDFIEWVDRYMKADPAQVYQYDGKDVYGARCAMVHTYSIEADFHLKNPSTKQFGYSDGGRHAHDPAVHPNLVIIGVASFANDFKHAVLRFAQEMAADLDLRARVESRLEKFVQTFPFAH